MHVEHAKEASFAAFNHTGMHRVGLRGIRADIHDNTGQAGTDTAFLDRLGNTIKAIAVGKHGFEEGGGARFQHFSDTQARTDIAIVFREVALQDPHAIAEPLDESHIVSAATNEGLGKMDMGINQAGYDEFSLYVDDFVASILALQGSGFANGDDTVAFNGDCPVGNDVTRGVHGDDGGVGEKHI